MAHRRSCHTHVARLSPFFLRPSAHGILQMPLALQMINSLVVAFTPTYIPSSQRHSSFLTSARSSSPPQNVFAESDPIYFRPFTIKCLIRGLAIATDLNKYEVFADLLPYGARHLDLYSSSLLQGTPDGPLCASADWEAVSTIPLLALLYTGRTSPNIILS